jgi:hypothetical protein
MKPVVSSLVALALAIAPLSAMAKPAHPHKAAHAKVVKKADPAAEKSAKAEGVEKANKGDKSERSPISRVKAGKKDGAAIKNVVHHAHGVDLGGAGHREPRVERGALVAASMKSPASHAKPHAKTLPVKATTASADLPRLPSPNASKPGKGGAEKGARKPASMKADAADDGAGEPARDEEHAELVARDRGLETCASEPAREGEAATKRAKAVRTASHKTPGPKACAKEPVEIVRGPEIERFELTKCDGSVAPLAVERLSILVRPGGAARPTAPVADLAKKPGDALAPGIRRVDPRLIARLQAVVDHFSKPEAPAKLAIISGYRPASVGSMHATGRAVDFRVEGVKNEEVVAFCKTLDETGCGYYPNSSFVHIDVRDAGSGHVTWIDASGPGEAPRYVTSWPPPAPEKLHRASAMERSLEDLAAEGEGLLRARRPLETLEQHTGSHDEADERTVDAPSQP